MVSAKACKIMLAMTFSLLLIISITIMVLLITDHNDARTPIIQIEPMEVPLGAPEIPACNSID